MAGRNILVLEHLRKELATQCKRILVTVRAPQVDRINLAVLRILLTERAERGIYLSIDKPDDMVAHILERYNIAPAEMGRADTGQQQTGVVEPKSADAGANRRVLIVSGIFCPTIFLDSIDAAVSTPEGGAELLEELRGMDFLMVDNLLSMTLYNSWRKTEEFFARLDVLQHKFPNLRLLMTTDKHQDPRLYELAARICDIEIELRKELL